MTKMDPSASPAKDARLIELDALRGLGAVTVVLYHLTTRFHEIFPNADHAPVYLWGGEYRVLLFFAISGFAIFFTMNHTASAADFVMNRVSRLFPAYWVAICLTVAFEYFGRVKMLQVSPTEAMLNFTMLQGYLYVRPVDGAYWTLAYELGFYASMLAIWKGPGFARLERICFGWLALKWLLWLWPDMPGRIATLLVLKFVPFFIIGMAFQRIWAGHRPPMQQVPVLAAALVTLFCTETADFYLPGVALVVIFAAMVGGWLRWLCVPPLLWFGGISYSLYLVHENIGFVIMLRAHDAGLNHWAGLALALVSVVLIGWAVNRWVERPAARIISAWWRSCPVRAALRPV